jgi:hypothetical protein
LNRRHAISTLVAIIIVVVILSIASVGGYAVLVHNTNKSSSSSAVRKYYDLIFVQSGVCSPPVYAEAYVMALNNKTTQTEPDGASIPAGGAATFDKIYSNMTFTVTQGTYSYSAGGSYYISVKQELLQ